MSAGPLTSPLKQNPSHRTSLLLVGLLVAVYVVQLVFGLERSIVAAGLYGPALANDQWWRLFSSGFMHAGLLHLFINSLALWSLSRSIGPVLDMGGRWRYLVLYFASMLAGALGAAALDPSAYTIGASGAIFGLLGAAVAVPYRLGLGWNRLGVGPWIALNVAFTLAIPGISIGGHFGGLVGGLILGWCLTPIALRGQLA